MVFWLIVRSGSIVAQRAFGWIMWPRKVGQYGGLRSFGGSFVGPRVFGGLSWSGEG